MLCSCSMLLSCSKHCFLMLIPDMLFSLSLWSWYLLHFCHACLNLLLCDLAVAQCSYFVKHLEYITFICIVVMLECSSLVSCCILDGIMMLIAELCHYCLLAICKPCIRFWWSLYRFRPKSTPLSSGTLGFPSWGQVQSFLSKTCICITYHIPHIMPCFASCCLRIAPWLIVSPFACVLALGTVGRRVRDRGARWVRLQGSR